MINAKIHFVIDKSTKAIIQKKKILKNNKNYSLRQSNVIVVVGGDGFMLQTLKKFYKYQKPFYGMNRGTYGFLMNKFKSKSIAHRIEQAKSVTISALEMQAMTKNNKKKSAIAINEVYLLRQERQAAILQILNRKNFLIKKLICDGVLVCTPAGSTAYNLSVNGQILSLNSKKLAVTPISPFRPRRWNGKIVSSSSLLKIKNLNIKKRPLSVVADNIEVRNVKSVKIRINKLIKFKLLYDRSSILTKKIKLEQFRRK